MKQYQTVVLNSYSSKASIDKLLNELAIQGYEFKAVVMSNVIIMERDTLIREETNENPSKS